MFTNRVFIGGHSFVVSMEDHLKNRFKHSQASDWRSYVTDELRVSSFVDEICFHGTRGAKVTQGSILPASVLRHNKFQIGILD